MDRWIPVAVVALAGALVTWLNRGERVVLHTGVATFYRAPLTLVLFVAFVAGMLTMMMLSLRQDMRMRQELRARGLLDDVPARPGPVSPRHEPLSPAATRADDATWAAPPPVAHSPWADMDAPRRAPDEDATFPHPRQPDPPAY